MSNISCQMELSSEGPSATKSQTADDLESNVCQFGKCKSREGNKTRGRDRGREGKVKAKSAGCEALTGQVHTRQRSIPTGLSNIDRNTHPCPSGLAGSEQKSSSCGPEQPTVEVKIKKENAITSKKIIILIDQYPMVTLCNIAQRCEAFSPDCGYVLPNVLKTKVVRCFKQDMRAEFPLGPGCLEHNKHERKIRQKKEFCPKVKSKKSIHRAQSLTEQQRRLNERTDAQTISSSATCSFLKSRTSEGSAPCSASSSLDDCTRKGECRTVIWDRDVEDDLGRGTCLIGAEIHRDKRIKLGDSVKDGMLPSAPDLERIGGKEPAKMESRDKEMSCDSQPCLERAVSGSSSFGAAVKENCAHKKPCGEIDDPTKTDATQMSPELFCQTNNVDTDELDSFTCQRVRAYFRKIQLSCARTYMSWPFSNSDRTPTARNTGSPAEPIDPSARDNSNSPLDQNQLVSSSNQTNNVVPDAPKDASSGSAHQFPHQNDENGEIILAEINGKRHGTMSSYSIEFAPQEASCTSDTDTLSNPSQRGRESGTEAVSDASSPVNRHEPDSSLSPPSPSAHALTDCETATAYSSMSSPFKHGGSSSLSATPSSLPPSPFLLKKVKGVKSADTHSVSASLTSSSTKCMVKAVEKALFSSEETQITSSSPSHNSDSFDSCQSSLLLPQDDQESGEGLLAGSSPLNHEPYYNTHPFNHVGVKEGLLHNILTETYSNEFMLSPMRSPVTSPHGHSRTSLRPRSPACSDEEEEEEDEISEDTSSHKMLPGCRMPQIVDGNNKNSKGYLEHGGEELDEVSETSSSNDEDVDDGNEEESQDGTDCEDDVEQGSNKSELLSDPKLKATRTSGALTEPCSSPSSDEVDGGDFRDGQPCSTREEESSLSGIVGSDKEAEDTRHSILDEFTAYEQDILLVDLIQDDSELFENLPQESLLKLGPNRVTKAPKSRPIGVVKMLLPRIDAASLVIKQRLTTVDHYCDSPDITEGDSRSWRPQCSSNPSTTHGNTWRATEKQNKDMSRPDANNNHVNRVLERSQPIQTVNSHNKHIPPLMTARIGPLMTKPANVTESRRQKSNAPQYCRQYFSESLSCNFKTCRFHHVPVEGDERLCIDTVTRFSTNPMCLQKAGAVFTGYYQNNSPGVYFSMMVLLSLLWTLLKAGMLSEVFSVLNVCLAHKIEPGPEFLLALFNIVREKGLMSVVPQLMQLTFKMASAGLVLSVDCFDCVKNTPEFQQTVNPNALVSVSGNDNAPFPEYLHLAHSIVEIELCTKQEDWRRMGDVFRSICQSFKHPNQVERICGRIAVVLLSESKDKLSLPFAAFAETVCQGEDEQSLIRSFLGRIGVSLMLRYHKTHQWAKGRRVVEVLSILKVNYSKLKGLFGNEDGASRCHLVTMATELLLLSGSLEGALNTLRENEWFLSSLPWPCEPADLESRTRVLMRLAERTSHRDTLEVLCNLPGLKEPNDFVDISKYGPPFNSYLQVCVDRQILPLAADTVDFMLCKKLPVDHALLQMLLYKLGKQSLWLRAREIFRHSLVMGYYPGVSAPPGFMALIVPCRLGEVELALTLEMLITVNATVIFHLSEATTSCLSITLKRTRSCESEYLAAGSRILSAACIAQPKLIVHYTAVNSSQEQVFTLDVSSARCWLRHNHLWANEVWTH
ncbi:uncharacterized protein topaz1 isoform X2 [Cottoperca gobio]|uniref:Protein TOPAZ1 n=1 Tax=Cottoperca gobio TaxID=56716 RepID=A0A6J2QL00_COTGO|nr:protein TOPAZ1 isoform X2 [Cottoperca gobio]